MGKLPRKMWRDAGADTAADSSSGVLPGHVGRYRVEELLDQDTCGCVYLAQDEQRRTVSIRVPNPGLVSTPAEAAAYLAAARALAGLDHPNIVPVHEVGSTKDCPC